MRRAARSAIGFVALVVVLSAALLARAAVAQTQPPATLIADRVEIRADRTLVAIGNVEVLYDGRRLRATSVEFDRVANSLRITGPIVLTDGEGSVLVADSAELSADLREGLLQSARLVLDRQLQLAANEVARVGGRYTRMSRVTASSCRVCDSSETPLWEIRARRVIHDEVERQIYFDEAQMRIAGLPIFWLPRLRMPDPTLTRATGFLMPRLVSTSGLGTGIQVPYFIRLGDHRDLTVTPFLATNGVASLGLRYRQAFRTGEIAIDGAVTRDQLVPGTRGFLRAGGNFDLGRGFGLRFAAVGVSDRTYLSDYMIDSKDRLDSFVTVERTRRDERIALSAAYFSSLRIGDDNATLPSSLADLSYERRIATPGIGGRIDLALQGHAHLRSSVIDVVGRDVARATVRAEWRRDWVLTGGAVFAVTGGFAADLHSVFQDTGFPQPVTTLTPLVAAELRWPLVRTTPSGAREVLEPVVQVVWSQAAPANNVPNEDSQLLEFDEGNLFALNRFPGADRREGGGRVNLGLAWSRFTASGWAMQAQAGRVLRFDDPAQFTVPSGLAGPASHWLVAAGLANDNGLAAQGRAVFDDTFDFARSELRLRLDRDRYGIASAWVFAAADLAENRPIDTSEWVVDARYSLSDFWTAKAAARYDFAADRATSAAIGLQFANECLRLDLSLSRSFTSSTSVGETTDFGFSVDFLGFGSGRAQTAAGRACRR